MDCDDQGDRRDALEAALEFNKGTGGSKTAECVIADATRFLAFLQGGTKPAIQD